MSSIKSRHYSHLASRLRNLNQHLSESEHQMNELSTHLLAMQRIGINTSSQFMAVGRILDMELQNANEQMQQLEGEMQEGDHGRGGVEEDGQTTPTNKR